MGYQFKIGMLQQTRATFAEKSGNIHRANMQVTWEKSPPELISKKSLTTPEVKLELLSNLRQHSPKNWYIVYLYSK